MPNQYSALSRENIIRKTARKRNPVRTFTQLAAEFGYNTEYVRRTGTRAGKVEHRAPASFMTRVRTLLSANEVQAISGR